MRRMTLALVGLWVALLPPAARPSDLHVLLVADTADSSIGNSVKVDVKRVLAEVDNVARFTSLTLRKQLIDGDRLTMAEVQTAVNSLSPKRDDVVLFYYSGHGFRTASTPTQWPSLALRGRSGIDQYAIFSALHKKQPRLLLAICDCCNNVLADGVVNVGRAKLDLTSGQTRSAYKNLFERSSGSIIASSSKPGEISLGNDRDGGLFTCTFVNSLQAWLSNDQATWNAVFRGACRTIPVAEDRSQTPQHRIFARFSPPGPSATSPPGDVPAKPSTTNGPTSPQPVTAHAPARSILVVMNGSNSTLRVTEVATGADSGVLALNGDHENIEVHAQQGQKIAITANGNRNKVYLPRSLAKQVRLIANGDKNDILYTGPAPAGKPAPGPAPAAPAAAPPSLNIIVSGSRNDVSLTESAVDPHSGTVTVSGIRGKITIRLAPNSRAAITLSGSRNTVTIPRGLKDLVSVTKSGARNEVVFK